MKSGRVKTDWSDILQPKVSAEEKLDSYLSASVHEDPRIQELESLYEKKYSQLAREYKKLKDEYDDLEYKYACNTALFDRQKKETKEEYQKSLKLKSEDAQKKESDWKEYVEYVKNYYIEMLKQTEEDYNHQIAALQAKLNESLKNEGKREQSDTMLTKVVELKRKNQNLKDELEAQKAVFLEQQRDAEQKMRLRIEQDTKLYREKAEKLENKLHTVSLQSMKYQSDVEEWKQARNILQYQMQELKETKGPLDHELNMLQEQTERLELDRISNRSSLLSLQEKLKMSQVKCEALSKELARRKTELDKRNKYIEGFTRKIGDIIHFSKGTPEEINDGLLSLYETYVRNNAIVEKMGVDASGQKDKLGEEITSAFTRQRNSLANLVNTMKTKVNRAEVLLKTQRQCSLAENMELMHENIRLRKSLVRRNQRRTVSELKARRLQRSDPSQISAKETMSKVLDATDPKPPQYHTNIIFKEDFAVRAKN